MNLVINIMAKFFLLTTIICVSLPLQAANVSWGLNDVTYIMPLPKKADNNNLLKLQSAGFKGPLVPEAMVMQLPFMDMQHEKAQINSMTRLMAARIDHCFPLPTPMACQKQIRLVWQPLQATSGSVTTIDAAFHSFYVLTDEEFEQLTADLKTWKSKYQTNVINNSTEPLSVHPLWRQERDLSPSLLAFNEIVTQYAGEKNLSRVTVMVLRRMNDVWGFLGADVVDGKLVTAAIPRLEGKTSQMFFNQLNNNKGYTGAAISFVPAVLEANLGTFIEQATTSGQFSESEVVTHMQSALAIENPYLFNPESMDCVNCHIAQAAREWLSEKLEPSVDQNLFSAFKYTNGKYNLENKSDQIFNTHQLRGVGYFGSDLAISQRVINESAVVAEWLSATKRVSK